MIEKLHHIYDDERTVEAAYLIKNDDNFYIEFDIVTRGLLDSIYRTVGGAEWRSGIIKGYVLVMNIKKDFNFYVKLFDKIIDEVLKPYVTFNDYQFLQIQSLSEASNNMIMNLLVK